MADATNEFFRAAGRADAKRARNARRRYAERAFRVLGLTATLIGLC